MHDLSTIIAMNNQAAAERSDIAKPETVDATPDWLGILPVLLAIIERGPENPAYRAAKAELVQMADLADRYVAAAKEGKV